MVSPVSALWLRCAAVASELSYLTVCLLTLFGVILHRERGKSGRRTTALFAAVVASLLALGTAAGPAAAATPRAVPHLDAPATARAGVPVVLALADTRLPGTESVAAYRLDFGDGSQPRTGTTLPRSVRHRFARPGGYRLTLTVLTSQRRTARGHRIVRVLPPPRPTVAQAPAPAPSAAPSAATPEAGSPAVYADAAVDPASYPDAGGTECVAYVAWWLRQHGLSVDGPVRGPAGIVFFGDARDWAETTARAGWTVSATPVVGSIAHWEGGEADASGGRAGPFGHIAVVRAVHADGSATVAQYNWGQPFSYSERDVRAPRYLYIGAPERVRSVG